MTTLTPVRTFVAISLATLLGGAVACSYDWDVGAPTDAGGGDAGTGGDHAGGDAGTGGGDAGSSCADLIAQLDAARDAAKKCGVVGTTCSASLTDECGCKSYVTQGGSTAANAFAAAVQSVKGCAVSCGTCLPSPGGVGTCLFSAGMGPFCQP